ncbi:MAG: hypothetical protein U0572_09535 [Phycisphaerales bacterium]
MDRAIGAPAEPHASIRCPRCDYDLAGLRRPADGDSGTTACPECGLSIDTAEVARWGDTRLLEHAPLRRLPVALVRTAIASLVPYFVWRRLRIEHAIRPSRLAMLVVFCVPWTALFAHAGLVSIAYFGLLRSYRANWGNQFDGRVEVWSLVRSFVGSLAMPWRVQAIECCASASPGIAWSPGCSPVSVITVQTWDVCKWSAGLAPKVAPLALLAMLGSVCAFAVLPVSRRRAGIRTSQLVRVGCYLAASMPLGATALLLLPDHEWTPWFTSVRSSYAAAALRPAALFWIAAWLVPWWYATTRWYLRMSSPLGIALGVTLMGVALAGTLIAIFELITEVG